MSLEELAIRSGFSICKVTGAWSGGVSCRRELEKFAELVRHSERERAALICESVNNHDNPMTARDCADEIRAKEQPCWT